MNPLRKFALAGAMAGATLGGAALGATMLGTAGAQTTTTTPSASASAPADSQAATTAPADGSTAPAKGTHASGPHQANGKTETVLTGDDLAKVTAAVESSQPGATIDRAETDADGDVYEAHITKADGTKATVKFDADFNITSVDAGMS